MKRTTSTPTNSPCQIINKGTTSLLALYPITANELPSRDCPFPADQRTLLPSSLSTITQVNVCSAADPYGHSPPAHLHLSRLLHQPQYQTRAPRTRLFSQPPVPPPRRPSEAWSLSQGAFADEATQTCPYCQNTFAKQAVKKEGGVDSTCPDCGDPMNRDGSLVKKKSNEN